MSDQPVGQHAAVKRTRSDSVESGSSSASNKRSSPSVALAAMDITNDAAGTGQASGSDSSSSSSSNATEPLMSSVGSENARELGQSPTADLPEGGVQVHMILPLMKQPLSEGDRWFIVDRNWFRKWQAACGGAVDDKGLADISLQEVGPIDNSRIASPTTGKITASIVENENAVFLPGIAWHTLEKWYGRTGVPVEREVYKGRDGAALDLFPPEVTVARVVPSSSPQQPSQPVTIQAGSGWTVSQLKTQIAQAMNVNISSPSRLWHLSDEYSEGTVKPDGLSITQLETAADSDILRQTTIGAAAHLAFEQANEDGSWLVVTPEANAPPSAATPATMFGGPGFYDKMQQNNNEVAKRRAELSSVTLASTSSRDSNASTSTRQARDRRRGLVGLQNLGNTCFMNSALQCLSNTPSLQQYFFTGFYKQELNPSNPLGMGGEVARAFGNLMERMWSGGNGPVVPREFKQTLSKFAPAFSGWQQHDSQELLAFLLDGLHEDLNRIVKKPYDEIPDWEGGGDKEEMELADKSWDLYKRRNDSVIVDLFQGQYRSRLTCPECQKVAIKFDPFMYLSLAIPQDKKWEGTVFLVPKDPKKPQIRVTTEVPFNATIRSLKQSVGELTGYDHKKLFCAEEYNHKFFRVWYDSEGVSGLQSRDIIIFYEAPYEVEQLAYRPTKAKTLQEEGKIVVSVLLSMSKDKLFGEPFVLALTEEEASDWQIIERRICERLEALQSVGSRIWADAPSNASSSERIERPSSKAAAINRTIPDDEMEEPVKEDSAMSSSSSTGQCGERLMNPSVARIMLARSSRPTKSFTAEPPSNRYSLQARFEEARSSEAEASTKTSIPGAFGAEENEDLYGSPTAEIAPPEAVSSLASTSCRSPILTVGEVLVVEWEGTLADEAFGREINKTRVDPLETMSLQERVTAPSILERKKNRGQHGERKGINVEQLLDEFVKEEKLSEDNMWYCPSCKKHQQAQKKFDLWKMPDVLVIHLKRFSNERAFRDKIDTMIDFPIEGLDLSNRVEGKRTAQRLAEAGAPSSILAQSGADESLIYDLFAVDNHFGGLGGGHYTCHAKNVNDGKWYYFDDTRVAPETPEQAKTSAAYLLFYIRRTDKIGGKTHDILASQAPTPSLSKEASPEATDEQPFREGGSSVGPQSGSFNNEPYGQYSRRSQGYGYGFSSTRNGQDPMTPSYGFDDDSMMTGPSSPFNASPTISEDGLPGYNRTFHNIPFATDHTRESTAWEFGISESAEKADPPVYDVKLEPDKHVDPTVVAQIAQDVTMDGDAGEMDEVE